MRKKVSIITVVRNNRKGLEETYKSIKSSIDIDVEWIVIDGNSNDGTVEFLKSISSDYIIWISEPDRNMYEAMNKGIKLAEGEYLQFLNAGDLLEVQLKNSFFLHNNNTDLVFYNIRKLDINKNIINWTLPFDFLLHLKRYPSVPHQSTFIKKNVFLINGDYSEKYKYLGDYEFFCRLFHGGVNKPTISYQLDLTLVSFICDGVTFNYRLSIKLLKECLNIQKIYFNKIDIQTTIIYILKYLLSYFPWTLKIANYMRRYFKH